MNYNVPKVVEKRVYVQYMVICTSIKKLMIR